MLWNKTNHRKQILKARTEVRIRKIVQGECQTTVTVTRQEIKDELHSNPMFTLRIVSPADYATASLKEKKNMRTDDAFEREIGRIEKAQIGAIDMNETKPRKTKAQLKKPFVWKHRVSDRRQDLQDCGYPLSHGGRVDLHGAEIRKDKGPNQHDPANNGNTSRTYVRVGSVDTTFQDKMSNVVSIPDNPKELDRFLKSSRWDRFTIVAEADKYFTTDILVQRGMDWYGKPIKNKTVRRYINYDEERKDGTPPAWFVAMCIQITPTIDV